jgi:N-acetyl-alpha-D-muramate 1-phosphate uridylyltransferase
MRAMVLAAGRGERMRPLTDHTPKPLLMAGGKPLIAWHLERLQQAGFTDVVVNTAHLGKKIETVLGNGERYGLVLHYSREGGTAQDALETAGGIAKALPLLGDAPFLIVNGDVYCDYPFRRAASIARQMAAAGQTAWLVMVPNPPHHPIGDFSVSAGFLQQATMADTPRFTYSGIGVFDPAFFAQVTPGSKLKLRPLLDAGIDSRSIGAELWHGAWEDIGTPGRLALLDASLNR